MNAGMKTAVKVIAAGIVFLALCVLGAGAFFYLYKSAGETAVPVWLFSSIVSFLCGVFTAAAVFAGKQNE